MRVNERRVERTGFRLRGRRGGEVHLQVSYYMSYVLYVSDPSLPLPDPAGFVFNVRSWYVLFHIHLRCASPRRIITFYANDSVKKHNF